ncbi:suppressor of fused domain protein [Flavobacterium sp. WLB]|uniref:suppressor of fused domain protein n=1 Tax=unclassified Flavobacterium TaxID=196869 RepID=UPI0006ABCB6C|nr:MULTISPECIES: suppressor of fused domain protein [unclassified Flavobacterium]KOP38436.1 riboflavin biosynthesis protein [Flavobacterium sp. VMW]OWU89954.1 riboflavin biosynthesis protein [Flavobacterium sp. NLM]PUU69578.1 suppressor of fused domain protein [Flavobacterium sp. WLB]
MTLEEYKKQFSEDDAVGWLEIDKEFERLYPDQEPKHFAPAISYMIGGEHPLDGVSIYESKKQTDHFHFVTYGFSELYYDENKIEDEFSKWGFELTFRLKPFAEDNGNPSWVIALLQNIAKYVFDSGNWFEEFHYMPANGPIRLDTETDITALVIVADPEIEKKQTPHGELSFLQIVGITSAEYEAIKENPATVEELVNKLKENNPLLITDLTRKS